MGTLEFIATVLGYIVWPGVVVVLAILFRSQFEGLFERLIRLKHKDTEIEFKERLKKVEATVIESRASPPPPPEITLDDLADVSPRAAILEAWISVEEVLADYLRSVGLDPKLSYQGLRRLPQEFQEDLSPILTPYQELRVIRNKAVHASDTDLSPEVARRFIQSAQKVRGVLLDIAVQ